MNIVSVLLPIQISRLFSYRNTEKLSIGQCVKVPFGPRTLWGIVWSIDVPEVPNLKDVLAVHPYWKCSEAFLIFLQKCSEYTLIPLGKVLRMAFPIPEILEWPWESFHCTPSLKSAIKTCPWPGTFAQWTFMCGVRKVQRWIEEGNLDAIPPTLLNYTYMSPSLTPEQTIALEQIHASGTTFIEGVTGSGKTEVCLAYIKRIIDAGQQVLILVPEISLCHQWTIRVQQYYSGCISVWHSGLSARERKLHGWNILTGNTSVVIGARSAVMLDYRNLGAIIVDEEHDPSYKQGEGYTYHGRDMAVYRAHYYRVPCLLMSATPSLETYYNVCENRYAHVTLSKRYGYATLPDMHIVDLKKHPLDRGHSLTFPLKEALLENITRGEQSLLFVNRRGYGTLFVCYRCGFRAACTNCSVWLSVHHAPKPTLMCHYCGFKQPLSKICPSCHHEEGVRVCGVGVEKVCEEVRAFLPDARLSVLSSDICPTIGHFQETLTSIQNQEYDILIGTQIIAKGHHFPNLTLVGIVDGDFALSHLDLRSGERLYQILCQVVGRAGRESLPGRAYIQTSQPEHPIFQYLSKHHIQGFLQDELTTRRQYSFPPYTRLAALTCVGTEENRVHQGARLLKQHFAPHSEVEILGPAPAPINPLRRRWRWKIFLKSSRQYALQSYIQNALNTFKVPSYFQIRVDIDPYDFL